MITKRPHILKYNLPPADSLQNESGDWVPGAEGDSVEVICRYEPNGSGRVVNGNDGVTVVYNGIVYLDVNAGRIEHGTAVEVYNSEQLIFKGNAINFSNGQLNSRLWV